MNNNKNKEEINKKSSDIKSKSPKVTKPKNTISKKANQINANEENKPLKSKTSKIATKKKIASSNNSKPNLTSKKDVATAKVKTESEVKTKSKIKLEKEQPKKTSDLSKNSNAKKTINLNVNKNAKAEAKKPKSTKINTGINKDLNDAKSKLAKDTVTDNNQTKKIDKMHPKQKVTNSKGNKSSSVSKKTSSTKSNTKSKITKTKVETKLENVEEKLNTNEIKKEYHKEEPIKQSVSNQKNNLLKKVFDIFSLSIKMLFIISFIMNLILLLKIDILPSKYLLIFLGFSSLIILFAVLTEFILKNKIMKFISMILSLVFIILYVFIFIYLNKTHIFINGLFNDEQIETYYLAVLSDSNYESINDLKNLKIGTYYNNEETYNQIIKIINKSIDYEEKNYDNLIELCNNLISGEIDAILINDTSKNIIDENNELINIQLKYIYNVTTKTKININTKDLNVSTTPFIVYITGIDTYGEISNIARSDVNIAAIVNPRTKEILLVTIPRDYYVQLHNTSGNRDKLTHAGIYGIDMSASTIEDLLDIDINYYIRLNFSTLINAVDAIGGIEVYSPYAFNTYGYQFHEGYNSLNGDYALAFSRARYNFVNGDRTRGENQMRVIEAIINKMSSSRVLITNYLDILNSLKGTFQTNIDSNRIYDLVKMQLASMPKWKIETYSLNGFDSSNYTYSMGDMMLYVMEPDYNTVNEAKEKIKKLLDK